MFGPFGPGAEGYQVDPTLQRCEDFWPKPTGSPPSKLHRLRVVAALWPYGCIKTTWGRSWANVVSSWIHLIVSLSLYIDSIRTTIEKMQYSIILSIAELDFAAKTSKNSVRSPNSQTLQPEWNLSRRLCEQSLHVVSFQCATPHGQASPWNFVAYSGRIASASW